MKKLIILALIALPLSAFAQKFAHVNTAAILSTMPEYTAAQEELQKLSKQYQDELKRMQDELQTTIQMYLNGVKNSLGQKLLYRGIYPGE